ncbi:acetyltransferase [Caulobacter sp. CCUG 60055]|uniref:acetyltransferase n=1 Tax=Caulobacter sp. CCUG 60055 TaxID=2100090 RepID=UPI001FA75A2A|nr:acetyltransferase [Caulobacter sp. CCUG 60055]MCI3178718.1 acetyltransferase [Caulobacter sp. CCUG 60055]
MIEIRPSAAADAPVLFEIWRRAVLATHDFLKPQDFSALEVMVARDYLPSVRLWVAEEGGRATGFMGLSQAHVDSLFIDPDARGRGIGRRLMAHARSLVGGALSVDVNEQNDQAVGFYRRIGFQQTGRSSLDDQGRPYPLLHMTWPA